MSTHVMSRLPQRISMCLSACGCPCADEAFAAVPVKSLTKGDKVLLRAQHGVKDPEFVLGTVRRSTERNRQRDSHMYKPVVDAPFMVLGGLVVPT